MDVLGEASLAFVSLIILSFSEMTFVVVVVVVKVVLITGINKRAVSLDLVDLSLFSW